MIETLDTRRAVLKDVVSARQALQASQDQYAAALIAASDAGISNVKIARELKLSETAIRFHLKRLREKSEKRA